MCEITEHHLLYWIFLAVDHEINRHWDLNAANLSEDHFQDIKAPEWVWPAYQKKLNEYRSRLSVNV